MTRDELIENAEKLIPALRERAAKTEELRRLPDETVRDFREAGLLRTVQPSRYGGYEHDLDLMVELVATVGRACGSSAWNLAILAVHNWLIAQYPEPAQEEVWGEDTEVLAATSFAPQGRATPADGGFRVRGQWQFSSACDHSRWVALGCPGTSDSGGPDLKLMLVGPGDWRIEDTWFVAGLRGTGSKDVVVEDAFVPSHRVLSMIDAFAGKSPGQEVHDVPLYRLPFSGVLAYALVGPALGIAEGAIETYTEMTKSKLGAYSSERIAEQAPAQVRLAEACSATDAARLLALRDCREMLRRARAREQAPVERRARMRWNAVYAIQLCTRAVDSLFEASGGHGLYDSNPMQRAFRDVHAVSAHAYLRRDAAASLFGRVQLGLPPNGPV